MDPTSSWLLPRSTAIGWLNEEDTMSSKHLWWGPFTSTFCEHWLTANHKRARVVAPEQCLGMLQRNSKEFLRRYVIVDETRIHY